MPAARANTFAVAVAMVLGYHFLITCNYVFAKYLAGSVDPLVVTCARFGVQVLVLLALTNPVRLIGLFRTGRPGLQIFRGLALFGMAALHFTSVKFLPVSQVVAIGFASPFFVALASAPVLGERVSAAQWVAIVVGFLGVLVVLRPGVDGLDPVLLLPVAAVACAAAFTITTRLLAAGEKAESPESMLIISAIVPVLAVGPTLPFVWGPVSVEAGAILLAAGISGTVSHALLTRALRLAPASELAPYQYLQIVSSSGLGFLIFSEVPDSWTLIGVGTVIFGNLIPTLAGNPGDATGRLHRMIAFVQVSVATGLLAIGTPAFYRQPALARAVPAFSCSRGSKRGNPERRRVHYPLHRARMKPEILMGVSIP